MTDVRLQLRTAVRVRLSSRRWLHARQRSIEPAPDYSLGLLDLSNPWIRWMVEMSLELRSSLESLANAMIRMMSRMRAIRMMRVMLLLHEPFEPFMQQQHGRLRYRCPYLSTEQSSQEVNRSCIEEIDFNHNRGSTPHRRQIASVDLPLL